MSVVNKMLRDLDHRHSAEAADQPSRASLARGVAAVVDPATASRSSLARSVAWVLAAALVSGAGLLGWSLTQHAPPGPSVASPDTPKSHVLHQPSQPSVPDAAPPVKPLVATRDRDQPESKFFRMETVLKSLPKERPDVATPTLSVSARTPVEQLAPVKVLPKPVVEASLVAGSVAQRQIAAAELVEQAQRLWNGGSRDAAIGLLRDAVLLAERDHGDGTKHTGSPALTSLVRELARMELAEGRVSQALERLMRLESALAGDADLWGLRGHAAQRLGRHRESAEAYLAALKLRPDQPRWMLGAAVSLAADGQTQAAASWAQSARERGALTPEVAAYLRQLGVNTTDF